MEREWKHRHPAGRVKVSLLPDFLCLISLGDASDCPVWLPFSYSSLHPVNTDPLRAVAV